MTFLEYYNNWVNENVNNLDPTLNELISKFTNEVLQQLFPDIYGGLQGTKLLDLAMKNGLVRAAKFKPFGNDKYSYEGSYHPMYVSSTAKKTLKDIAGHYQMDVKDDFAHYSHKPDTQPVTQPTTQPATQPTTQPTTQPDTQPPVLGL